MTRSFAKSAIAQPLDRRKFLALGAAAGLAATVPSLRSTRAAPINAPERSGSITPTTTRAASSFAATAGWKRPCPMSR